MPRSTRRPPRSRRSWPRARRARPAESRGAGPPMATLTYMAPEHVPVLASELIALLDPQPGETAVDCTFGGGGQARLVGGGPGGERTRGRGRRDPSAGQALQERRAGL